MAQTGGQCQERIQNERPLIAQYWSKYQEHKWRGSHLTETQFEANRINAYFSHVATRLGRSPDVEIVVVAHMVPNAPYFLNAISQLADVGLVLPKPKSVQAAPDIFKDVRSKYSVEELDREWTEDANEVIKVFTRARLSGKRIVIVDIGGYFAPSIDRLTEAFDGEILGVMEGTENGAAEYEKLEPATRRIATVARSPLKLPEDYLVGSSVVFSVESVLRQQAQILQTRTACVIGYGRVGSAVGEILRNRGISTVIYDIDPVKNAEAAAKGFRVFRRLDAALAASTLVICATGSDEYKALDKYGLASLRSGTVVASVTSADTVLDENALIDGYGKPVRISDTIQRYDEHDHRYFWLINGGNAVNFLDGAVIGPAIQLIEGEKLAAISAIADKSIEWIPNRLAEVDDEHRKLIANIWNEHFLDD
jgi:adenosylhomocysteinase